MAQTADGTGHAAVAGFTVAVADHVRLSGENEDFDAFRIVVPGLELNGSAPEQRRAVTAGQIAQAHAEGGVDR